MKKMIPAIFSLCLLALSLSSIAQKGREKYEHVKEKSFTRTYTAGSNKLSIQNSFGDVKVNTWNNSEIKVEVKIEVTSSDANRAQETFDAISVADKQNGNNIEFVTNIKSDDNRKDKNCKNCKTSMHIDYTVYLPASSPLTISNSFGSTELPDYSGPLNIDSKFGSFNAGQLSSPKKINVEFGTADIKKTSNLDASFKFSTVNISSLSGSNNIEISFCGDSKISLDADLSSLKLSESYSSLNLVPASGLSASYSIRTSFGDFRDRSGIGINRTDSPQKYGPDADKSYSGQKGNGSAKVTVSSSFGMLILGEPNAEDKKVLKEKSKDKNKQGTKNATI